jgi:RND superfamily putative drug exporter
MKEIGVGLAAAVLLDALVVRAVVLPALMTLLGRANWWPSHLGRARRQPLAEPVASESAAAALGSSVLG